MKSLLFLLAALLPFATAHGLGPDEEILRRHDRPDSLYVALGSRFAHVLGHVEDRAESTLVAPRWVVTAAHVIDQSGPFDDPWVDFGRERFGVEKIVLHPEWEHGWPDMGRTHDLALLKLDRAVDGVEPVPLYPDSDEAGRVVTIVGRGKTGTGVTGRQGEKGTVVRGATSQVAGTTGTVLYTVFDAPDDPDATDLEGAGASGDSGGPALLEKDDRVYLAGVGSFGTAARGYPAYGSIDGYVRVSSFREWIASTITRDPPSTVVWGEPVRYHGRWPDTPAGRIAGMLFDAMETGEKARLVELFRRLGDESPGRAERLHDYLRSTLGPVGPIHGFAEAEGHIRVLAYFPREDVWRSIGFVLAPDEEEAVLERFYIKWESAPKSAVWR
ncbi:MAG: trypsin-like serine protease [Gemmatimonadota bacterium]|nr:trypsin-like serine protease [Gemmatimonadota bacterium]